jgi:hypothetical protein
MSYLRRIERQGNLGLKGMAALLFICSPCSLGRSQSYQNAPFDPAATTLPPGYYGYDPEAFVKAYQETVTKEERARQKDEFETTAQYQKRLREMDVQNPFVNKIYAFAVLPTSVTYNADTQTFSLEFRPGLAAHNVNYVYATLKQGAKDMGDYTAQNAFGATFTVTRSLFSIFQLWLPRGEGPTNCAKSAAVPPPEARTLKSNIFALAVVKTLQPYVSVTTTFTEATFSEPHENTNETAAIFGSLLEVRFYDRLGGRVLASCP